MSKQLGINPPMDKLAADNGLEHWSCTDPINAISWLRSDGLVRCFLDAKPLFDDDTEFYLYAFSRLVLADNVNSIGKDWQQPEASLKDDIAHDRAYRNGMKTGWNFAMNNDSDGFNNSVLSLTKGISEARKELAEGIAGLIAGKQHSDTYNINVIHNSRGFTIDCNGQILGLINGDMGYEGTGMFVDDACKNAVNAITCKPTLVQKPFKYPCEGALYFTRESREQVFLTGYLNHHEKQVVGKLSTDRAGKFMLFNAADGCVSTGNSANNLIMIAWE